MVPSWHEQYIGLPYEDGGRSRMGIDCWGLFRLVMLEQFNITVPIYSDHMYVHTPEGRRELEAFIQKQAEADEWCPIATTVEEVERYIKEKQAQVGDGLRLKMGSKVTHVGLALDHMYMLHIENRIFSICEDFTSMLWTNRIHAVYRHKALV